MKKSLPVLETSWRESSILPDGSRKRIVPLTIDGRFATARKFVFAVLVAILVVLPWVKIAGNPAVFLDIPARRFFLFGATFNAQDAALVVLLFFAVALTLVVATSLLGRAFCGWACPQTVFLEGLFRPFEQKILGTIADRKRRERLHGPTANRGRTILLHAIWIVLATFVAHVFVSYFVSIPKLFQMVRANPAAHPEAFLWMAAVTAAFYGNFSRFREQTCLVVCPYGRLQAVLVDDDSLVVGYDATRGEPRGKAVAKASHPAPDAAEESGPASKGACVDCGRCVAVCPTGIDIRNGLQLDCVACSACIDACDDVMDRLKQPRGLIRYDSLNGLAGRARRVLRPRLALYAVAAIALITATTFATRRHHNFEANLLRNTGTPYFSDGKDVVNGFELHVVNKGASATDYTVAGDDPRFTFVVPIATPHLEGGADVRVPVMVRAPKGTLTGEKFHLKISAASGESFPIEASFLGPAAGESIR